MALKGKFAIFIFALVFMLVFSAPAHSASSCPAAEAERYPGWALRFNSTLRPNDIVKDGANGTFGMRNMSVILTRILSDGIASVKVRKFGSGGYEQDFSVTEGTSKAFDVSLADIRIKGQSINLSLNQANVSIWTHSQAILNATINNITYRFPDLNGSLPGDEIEIELEIKNIGELGAEDLQITKNFEPFIVTYEDVSSTASTLCQNSTIKLNYKMKAPLVKEDANYTITFILKYKDYNEQLLTEHVSEDRIEVKIRLLTPKLKVEKSTGTFTILNVGKEVGISNVIENVGNLTALNIKLIDIVPPELLIISGMPSQEFDSLNPGKKRTFSYTAVSSDPLMCLTASRITYEDENQKAYEAYSDRTYLRFSPFVRIRKTITDQLPKSEALSYDYPIKTRYTMKSNYSGLSPTNYVTLTADAIMRTYNENPYWSLCKDEFWKGESDKCTDADEPKIAINKSSMITVTIENIGNTIARDVVVNESLRNIEVRRGDTSWKGSLYPGESANYTYVAIPLSPDIDIETQGSYIDIDPRSLELNISGYTPGVCTKKLKNVTFSTSAVFNSTVIDAAIEQPNEVRIYENSRFDLSPVIFNNGSEDMFDLEVMFSVPEMTIAKGQNYNFIGTLTKGYNVLGNRCDASKWNAINITREVEEKEIIYQLTGNDVIGFVDGAPAALTKTCEDNGLELKQDISLLSLRYPFHVPAETGAANISTREVVFLIQGNPVQVPLVIWTPSVKEESIVPVKTTIRYKDVYGNEYTKTALTNFIVVPSGKVISVVRIERLNLSAVINYTSETKIGETGEMRIELKNMGYGDIDSYNLTLDLPPNVEIATNDTNWTGRVEAQIKRENDTLYVFSGKVKRGGNLSKAARVEHYLLVRGTYSGDYNLSYNITYDTKVVEGVLPFKVKGADVKASHGFSSVQVKKGEELRVTTIVKNFGEIGAKNVLIEVLAPDGAAITGGEVKKEKDVLSSGEEISFNYTVKLEKTAKLGALEVSWKDELGNLYRKKIEGEEVKVIEEKPAERIGGAEGAVPGAVPETIGPGKIITKVPVEEEKPEFEITTKEAIATLGLSLVVLVVVVKILTLKIKVEEEE